MKILVTGFGPFERFRSNPAEAVADHLAKTHPDVEACILPVVYGEAGEVLLEELERVDPDRVISFGLNATIGHINLEEVAVNIRSSEIPDNKGRTLEDAKILEKGPLAYRTRLPIVRLMDHLRKNGIPAKRSYSAGVYICNEVFYLEMDWAHRTERPAGFVHIPIATEMIAERADLYRTPHMSMEMLKKAGELIMDGTMKFVK
ncbi:MAG: peptidase C15 [Candidatus Thermoplasmatota archaeon]|nr:peptidase C15 [Candidatus Thermoplasmatota archaeon]